MPTLKGLRRAVDTIERIDMNCIRIYVDVDKNIYYDIYRDGKIKDVRGRENIIDEKDVKEFFYNFSSVENSFLTSSIIKADKSS